MGTQTELSESDEDDERGIFSDLIGHSGAKAILRAAVRSGDVHILLSGEPGSGKSVALLALEEYVDGAVFKDARGFTETQLRSEISENPQMLLLDEFDDMKRDAYSALSMPMEQNRVTKDTAHNSFDVEVTTQFFAACNDPDDLPKHTADRFQTVHFDEYSLDEYREVCGKLLPRIIDWVDSEQEGRMVASIVHDTIGSKNVRTARDVAKLAGEMESIAPISKALDDPKADVRSVPITPDEVNDLVKQNAQANSNRDESDEKELTYEQWKRQACEHLSENAPQAASASLAYKSGRLTCPKCKK